MSSANEPALTSWVPVPADSDFPIQNLPFGVFSSQHRSPRIGIAIGEAILDIRELAEAGLVAEAEALVASTLNPLLGLGRRSWTATRNEVSDLLRADNPALQGDASRWLVPAAEATMHLPIMVGDYVDFYSSLHHATNLGRMLRPDAEPLLPNWRHLPIGYHGRSSTVVVSGTPVARPRGQRKPPDAAVPAFGPTARLDFELEVGFVTGNGPGPGRSIAIGDAEHLIFGMVLVNDWSARDLQAWEYVPLGPFLGKSFATSISPWVVTMDALEPFRVPQPPQEPEPLPYLAAEPSRGVNIELSVELNGSVLSEVTFADMYWTPAQQLVHLASNGARIRAGDLNASGTVSGPEGGSEGSLIEATDNGRRPVVLGDGTSRTFLEDGDVVTLHGRCRAPGAVSIGFGTCTGAVAAG